MSTQEYWFTETGEWGSNDVETVTFEGHHDDIHEAFDMVSDWELPAWAAYLAKRPHKLERPLEEAYCVNCADLVEKFHG